MLIPSMKEPSQACGLAKVCNELDEISRKTRLKKVGSVISHSQILVNCLRSKEEEGVPGAFELQVQGGQVGR
jgi:hypothetical protein